MLRRFGTLLVCIAMFFIAGGHWAVLQGVAWAGMLQSYAQSDGIAAAVQKTFSGDYPCAMCRKIDAQKKQEQQTPLAKNSDKKIEGLVAGDAGTPAPRVTAEFSHPRSGDCFAAARLEAPPVPVPILG